MRKNFLMTFVLLVGLLFGVQPNAHAYYYPDYWNGDRNFIFVDGKQGAALYMKKSSLNVEQYAPPIYVISVDLYHVDDPDRNNTRYRSIDVRRFRYNFAKREMYTQDRSGKWNRLMSGVSSTTTSAGEMAFYIAYGKKFYGDYPDDFYRRAR